jgi:hypothetical protein
LLWPLPDRGRQRLLIEEIADPNRLVLGKI